MDKNFIPLWNLYTPNMHGDRIRLPKFPFKNIHIIKMNIFLKERIETYINIEKIYNENKVSIVATQPELVEIQYTDDKEKLYPKVRKVSAEEKFQQYLNDGMIETGN